MPKIRSRRRFRKTPYVCYNSHVAYLTKPTVTSKRDLKLAARHTGKEAVTKSDESLGELRDIKLKEDEVTDVNPLGNCDGSTSEEPADQVSSSSTVITFVNDHDGPAFHCDDGNEDDDDTVPELPTKDNDIDDATVPSGYISPPAAAAKEKVTGQSKACGLNCHNECHENLTVGISYFSDVDMCEECVANIERACSQCQLAYKTKKLVGKSNSSSFIG